MDTSFEQEQDIISRVLGSAQVIMWEARLPPVEFTYVSPFAEVLFGYPVSDWYRQGFWASLIHPDDQPIAFDFCFQQTQAGMDHSMEYRMRHADGHYIWIRDIVTVAEPTDDALWMRGAIFDISEERRMAESLRAAKEEAEAANQARTRFLSQVGHELRTPLNASLGAVQLLQLRRLSPELEPLIGIINDANETLLSLIEDVTDISRSWSQPMALEPAWLDPIPLVRRTLAVFEPSAHRLGITMSLEPQLPPGVQVKLDASRFRQILSNLIGNALRHAGESHVTVALRFTDGPSDTLELVVRDTGKGMPAEVRDRALEPFFRGGESYGDTGAGMGLGLSIVQQITQAMQGQVSLESAEGQGTTARVVFPVEVRKAPHAEPAPVVPKVLCVEDNRTNAFILGQLLENFGVGHCFVETGEAAIGKFEEQPQDFALVLMDVLMQPTDGLETTRRLRALEAELSLERTPIVAVTAHTLVEHIDECLAAGMDAHLSKPVRIDDLQRILLDFGALPAPPEGKTSSGR
ncbi:MAG: hybrid sensor histidine kinase/response regulator [Pseudomonadota bacterium]